MPIVAVKHESALISASQTFPIFSLIKLVQTILGCGPSKTAIARIWCVIFLAVCSQIQAKGQSLKAEITVIEAAPAKVRVSIEFPGDTDELSFRNTYAGIIGLAQRIENVKAESTDDSPVKVERRAPGEFRSVRKAKAFSYEVNLVEPARLENMSHVSWLNREHGLLMPADLFPRSPAAPARFSDVRVTLNLPDGWTTQTNIGVDSNQEFVTTEPDKAVFLIGPKLRTANPQIGSGRLAVVTSGDWPFSTADLQTVATRIVAEYVDVTGSPLRRDSVLMVMPLPGAVGTQRWTAETRGNSVVLLVGSNASRKQLLNRLAILLSHELFHLWVPNNLKLDGDYDWFFEGFTLYQALLTDMRLGLISFDDYLQTIGRVFQSYLSTPDRDKWSLIEASERRWTTSSSLVYDKGMLVAFLYDLQLRESSDCSSSVSSVYRELFLWEPTGHENANELIIRLLSKPHGMDGFTKQYVAARGSLQFEEYFAKYGLEFQDSGPRLKVKRGIDDGQRKLLRCLGYRSG